MENIKMYDSELKLMEIVWENEPISAKDISIIAGKTIGWNKNTTYTILKKLVSKKVILRSEPNFICTSLVKKEDIQKTEMQGLIDKLFGGSRKAFFASFIDETISNEELEELKELIEKR